MEMMPHHTDLRDGSVCLSGVVSHPGFDVANVADPTTVWQECLPVLRGKLLQLRELRKEDAPSLLALLTREEVARFVSPPPSTIAEFERFIAWTHRRRAEGTYVCFAVVPEGLDTAVGIFQVRALEPGWETAEWGFALGMPYWGTGMFVDGAKLVMSFAFNTLGVQRLEARACLENGRGGGALRKLGAVCEAVMPASFTKDGRTYDQGLWVLLREAWHATWTMCGCSVH
jgi:[ribosomal protein S5]-alanine N-acetyltransferase